jgi:Flp pilus assembly protein TadG
MLTGYRLGADVRFCRQCGRRKERGASLVEYAFILILFFSLIFGVSGFGHALYAYHFVNEAAKEATRYAAVRGATCANDADGGSCQTSNSASGTAGPTSQTDVVSYVTSITPPSIDSSKVTVTATWPGPASPPICFHNVTLPDGTVVPKWPDKSPGCSAQVTVAYPYNFIFPLLPAVTTTTAPCTNPGFCLKSTSEIFIAH